MSTVGTNTLSAIMIGNPNDNGKEVFLGCLGNKIVYEKATSPVYITFENATTERTCVHNWGTYKEITTVDNGDNTVTIITDRIKAKGCAVLYRVNESTITREKTEDDVAGKVEEIVGMTYEEAAAVTNEEFAKITEGSLGSKFNEFQYFTGVTRTPNFTAKNPTTGKGFGLFKNVIEITTPPSLKRLGNYSFQVQGALKITLNEGLEELGGAMFYYATSSKGTVNKHITNNTGVSISNYGGLLTIPSTVTRIGEANFSGFLGYNARFCVLKLLPTTPPTLLSTIGNNYAKHILVPPGTLETYKAASGWSSLASYMAEWVR